MELFEALCLGDLGEAQRLLEKGACVRAQDEDGCSLMHRCCSGGMLDAAKWLFQNGAAEDIRTPDFFGGTPMIAAFANDNLEVSRWLFEVGAAPDIRSRDISGYSPMLHACGGIWPRSSGSTMSAPPKTSAAETTREVMPYGSHVMAATWTLCSGSLKWGPPSTSAFRTVMAVHL